MNRLFSDKELKLLIVPLLIEQVLAITVGMADTMMISYAGEAAISGVALVDLINLLLINVFAALATGGAVVSSQYLGKGSKEMCRESAGQLLIVTTFISLAIMAIVLAAKRHFLGLLYPTVTEDVMVNAVTYLQISAYSYPFLAVFNSCAALFRSMGNSKVSMKVSVLMNLINVVGNAILIFGFSMGRYYGPAPSEQGEYHLSGSKIPLPPERFHDPQDPVHRHPERDRERTVPVRPRADCQHYRRIRNRPDCGQCGCQ